MLRFAKRLRRDGREEGVAIHKVGASGAAVLDVTVLKQLDAADLQRQGAAQERGPRQVKGRLAVSGKMWVRAH